MGKAKTYVYSGQAGSLASQFLELKTVFEISQKMHRELIMVQSKDESTGIYSFNLCDVFEMPEGVSCTKNMKMKCDEKPSQSKKGSAKDDKKKKVMFVCEHLPIAASDVQVSAKTDLMPKYFELQLLPERNEEVEYIQNVLGYNIAGQPAPAVADYTALYWGQAKEFLGKDLGPQCAANVGTENANCLALKQALAALAQTAKPYCAAHTSLASLLSSQTTDAAKKSANLCYIAGASAATAQEAGLMLELGLMSFRGAWLQHSTRDSKTGLYDESALVPINAVSVEVMEWGVMVGAKKFVSLTSEALSTLPTGTTHAGDVLLVTSLVEHERARAGKTFCTAHRDGINTYPTATTTVSSTTPSPTDPTWCGKMKANKFIYAPLVDGEFTDDGPFENPTLNKFVVGLALYLLNIFSSRFLQLVLGGLCVVFIVGVTRLCYTRWYRANNKTF